MRPALETLFRGGSLCLAGLFVIASFHKVRLLLASSAADEPLLRLTRFRRRHATAALAIALHLEGAVAAALVIYPTAGFPAAGLMAVGYAAAARRLPAGEPCNCFGRILESAGGSAIVRRNLAIAAFSAVGALEFVAGTYSTRVSAASVALALTAGAALAAVRLSNTLQTQPVTRDQTQRRTQWR